MRKEKKYHYIYKTTNNLSGRYYYGMHSTNNLEDGYIGSGTYLRRAIRKHGKENFTKEIVEFCKTRKELKSREQKIVSLQEIANKKCMNLKVGGGGSDHIQCTSDETKQKQRNAKLGNTLTEEHKKNIGKSLKGKPTWTLGSTLSEEHKKNISSAGKGLKRTVVKCPHCGITGGKNTMTRWHFDNCMSNINVDMKLQLQIRKKHGEKSKESNANRIYSDETRKKMSESHIGQTPWNKGISASDETKKKQSIAMKRYWQSKK